MLLIANSFVQTQNRRAFWKASIFLKKNSNALTEIFKKNSLSRFGSEIKKLNKNLFFLQNDLKIRFKEKYRKSH
jgi:hypothetical protein